MAIYNLVTEYDKIRRKRQNNFKKYNLHSIVSTILNKQLSDSQFFSDGLYRLHAAKNVAGFRSQIQMIEIESNGHEEIRYQRYQSIFTKSR